MDLNVKNGPYGYPYSVESPLFDKADFLLFLKKNEKYLCPIAEGYRIPGASYEDHLADADNNGPNIFEHPKFDIDHFISWTKTSPVEKYDDDLDEIYDEKFYLYEKRDLFHNLSML